MEKFKCNEYGLFHDRNGSWRMRTDNSLCRQNWRMKSVEFEEHSETEETGIEEAGIERIGTDESESGWNTIRRKIRKETESWKRGKIPKEKDQGEDLICLNGKSEEEDKETENKKKTQNFTVA